MRKPLNTSRFATGTTNRFGRSSLGGGPSPANSNTRILGAGPAARPGQPAPARPFASQPFDLPARLNAPAGAGVAPPNHGLNSDRSRERMVARLREQGITNETVLAAMRAVPRHLFVDEGLASHAYEDAALPIGHEQTISQPWVVAHMIATVAEGRELGKVLEVGAGCGYQAAVLAHVAREVHTIERIRGLYEMARANLQRLRLPARVRVAFGDGMAGLPGSAPFDAILVAAAGIKIPQTLLEQLAVGGRLIAPEGGTEQRLVLIERISPSNWRRSELEAVRFVPLRPGTQY